MTTKEIVVELIERLPEDLLREVQHNDHSPAHFPAEYAEREATFTIDTLEVLEGELPRRPRAFVIEWASLHREELRANWDRARQGLPLNSIEPLE